MTSSGCSPGRVHQLGPRTMQEAHPGSEQELLHGVIKAREENPLSPEVTEGCFGKWRKEIPSFRQYH